MKSLITSLLICLLLVNVSGQKTDYNWLAGYESNAGYDTNFHYWFGITKFDFNEEPVLITRDSLGIDFNFSNSTISDSNGNILFYCNGVQINNSRDELIENGDSLGEGYFLNTMYPDEYLFGAAYNQYLLVLPNSIKQNNYDIFNIWVDSFGNDGDIAAKRLERTSLDMNTNAGKGLVTLKNFPVLTHEINFAVTAVKHGNGRDWWVCTYAVGTNCFDVMLYDGSDTLTDQVSCGGIGFPHGQLASMRFSTNGEWFVMASTYGYVDFYDFDRCTGILTFKDTTYLPQIVDSMWYPWDLEFSPSGRFVYIFCTAKIYQFDMLANPVSGSQVIVGAYAGFEGPFPENYDGGQLAPDGKIYVNANNSNYYVGVIDSPDLPGVSCKFLDHSLQVPTFIDGLDYFPNYRLGALTAAGCDSLTGISEDLRAAKETIIKVFPNPASDYTVVDYGFTDWSKGAVQMKILDALGEIINTTNLPMYSGFQRLDISNFASGIYFVEIVRSGDVIGAAKFVKQ